MLKNFSILDSLKYSKSITKPHWKKVFNYYILVSIGGNLLLQIIIIFLIFLFPFPLIYNVLIAFMQGIFDIFTYAFLTILFIKLDFDNKQKNILNKIID